MTIINTAANWQQVVATLQPMFEGVLTPGEIADAKKVSRGKLQPGDILAWTEDQPERRTVQAIRRQGLPFSIVSDEREIMIEASLARSLQSITVSNAPEVGADKCVIISAQRNDDGTWTLSHA